MSSRSLAAWRRVIGVAPPLVTVEHVPASPTARSLGGDSEFLSMSSR